MLSVKDAIRKAVRKFEDENGFINLIRYSKSDFETSYNLEDEIEFLLTGLNLEHNVELVMSYQDYHTSYYVLCVSYVNEGKLETYNIPVNM